MIRLASVHPRPLLFLASLGLFLLTATAPRAHAEAQADPGASVVAKAAQLDSPAATMTSYLEAAVPLAAGAAGAAGTTSEAWERAWRVFDLSRHTELQRAYVGRDVAEKLVRILDRIARIDVGREEWVDAGSGGSPWTWSGSPPGRSDLVFEIDFVRQEDGRWLIGADTVQRIPQFWNLVADLPVVEGVEEKVVSIKEAVRRLVPKSLQGTGFILETWQWIGLLLLVVLGVVSEKALSFVWQRIAARLTRSERRSIDRELLGSFERPLSILVTAAVVVVSMPLLDIKPDVFAALDLAGRFVLAVAGVWAAYRLVDVFCWFLAQKAAKSANTFDDMLVPLLRRTLKIFVVIVGLVFVASRLTDDLWSIVAGLSIGSLAIGFAAKDSIENLFGTFTILVEKPFKLGDWIQVGDIDGNVEEVGFRSTRVRTFYNSVITIPNRHFIIEKVDNMGERRYRRTKTMLSLTYDTPPEKIEAFCEGIRQLIQTHPYTRKDYYHVYLNEFSDSALNVMLYCFHETPDWSMELRERHRLFLDIIRLADELKVSFAFPTQTLHMARPEDLEHPDRPPDAQAGVELGERVGRGISEVTLKPFRGARPGPVVFPAAGGGRGGDDGE